MKLLALLTVAQSMKTAAAVRYGHRDLQQKTVYKHKLSTAKHYLRMRQARELAVRL